MSRDISPAVSANPGSCSSLFNVRVSDSTQAHPSRSYKSVSPLHRLQDSAVTDSNLSMYDPESDTCLSCPRIPPSFSKSPKFLSKSPKSFVDHFSPSHFHEPFPSPSHFHEPFPSPSHFHEHFPSPSHFHEHFPSPSHHGSLPHNRREGAGRNSASISPLHSQSYSRRVDLQEPFVVASLQEAMPAEEADEPPDGKGWRRRSPCALPNSRSLLRKETHEEKPAELETNSEANPTTGVCCGVR